MKLLGSIDGCTNAESAELMADGETVLFSNCTMTVGVPAFRGGAGLVYVAGRAFLSKARLDADGLHLVERRFVEGLTATLGIDVLHRATGTLPAGTALVACGGRPQTVDGATLSSAAEPQILAVDPVTGEQLGRIALGVGSPLRERFNAVDMPNGIAVDGDGAVVFTDIPNSNPASDHPEDAPVPPAVYRIPHAAIDALITGEAGSADGIERILMPGTMPNGAAVSPVDGSVWVVTCCPHCAVGGGIYRLSGADWAAGTLPEPAQTGLGLVDGIGVTRRGTVLASTPLTGRILAFAADGAEHTIDVAGSTPVQMPADFNVAYPPHRGGEPVLLVPDISVGRPPQDAAVAVIDISGL